MKKTEIDYFKNRIAEAVKCTNGEISTRLNKNKKRGALSTADKLDLIRTGKAVLRPDFELAEQSGYRDSLAECVSMSFSFPLTAKQEEAESFNQTIKNKEQELHTEVELEGKRLLDRMVLGLVTADQVADELKALGNLVSLAVMK